LADSDSRRIATKAASTGCLFMITRPQNRFWQHRQRIHACLLSWHQYQPHSCKHHHWPKSTLFHTTISISHWWFICSQGPHI